LSNEGQDPYKPEVYGDSIIVERRLNKTGSSDYKIKTSTGRNYSSYHEHPL